MTRRKALRVIPDRWRLEARQNWRLADVVVLVVTTNEKGLTVSQVEIEFEDITVLRGRRRSVKTKPTCVDAIAGCDCVVSGEAPCYVFEKVESRLADARSYAIRVQVGLI